MDFNHVKVSTQTYIVQSNIAHVNLVRLAERFEPTRSLVHLKYKSVIKGPVKVAKRHLKKTPGKMFLNCATIAVLVDDDDDDGATKIVNVKIFTNGVFQITGCKKLKHATTSIQHMISLFYDCQCFSYDDSSRVQVYIISVMRNIDFGLDFKINREVMATIIQETTDYCVPPLTKGYMGIKIKIPLKTIDDLTIVCMSFDPASSITARMEEPMTFKTLMTDIVQNTKKLKKERFISISVFQNGKVLMSGPDVYYQKTYYDWFVRFITEHKHKITYVSVHPTTKKTFKLQ